MTVKHGNSGSTVAFSIPASAAAVILKPSGNNSVQDESSPIYLLRAFTAHCRDKVLRDAGLETNVGNNFSRRDVCLCDSVWESLPTYFCVISD